MKLHLYITNTENFLRNEYNWCFGVSADDSLGDAGTGWIHAGAFNVEIDVDSQKVVDHTLAAIEAEEQRIQDESAAKLNLLRERKNQLIAIEYKG